MSTAPTDLEQHLNNFTLHTAPQYVDQVAQLCGPEVVGILKVINNKFNSNMMRYSHTLLLLAYEATYHMNVVYPMSESLAKTIVINAMLAPKACGYSDDYDGWLEIQKMFLPKDAKVAPPYAEIMSSNKNLHTDAYYVMRGPKYTTLSKPSLWLTTINSSADIESAIMRDLHMSYLYCSEPPLQTDIDSFIHFQPVTNYFFEKQYHQALLTDSNATPVSVCKKLTEQLKDHCSEFATVWAYQKQVANNFLVNGTAKLERASYLVRPVGMGTLS